MALNHIPAPPGLAPANGYRVQFPGTSPEVLTVAASGKIGECPPDSYRCRLRG